MNHENKIPLLPHSIVNQKADANFDLVQPYRIVAGVGNTAGTGQTPPSCFFISAIIALRADPSERVLVLAGRNTQQVVSEIVQALEPTPHQNVSTKHGGVEVREDGAAPQHLTDCLLSALRVVWGDPVSILPTPAER